MKADGKYLNHIADRQVNVPVCYNIIRIIIREKVKVWEEAKEFLRHQR